MILENAQFTPSFIPIYHSLLFPIKIDYENLSMMFNELSLQFWPKKNPYLFISVSFVFGKSILANSYFWKISATIRSS